LHLSAAVDIRWAKTRWQEARCTREVSEECRASLGRCLRAPQPLFRYCAALQSHRRAPQMLRARCPPPSPRVLRRLGLSGLSGCVRAAWARGRVSGRPGRPSPGACVQIGPGRGRGDQAWRGTRRPRRPRARGPAHPVQRASWARRTGGRMRTRGGRAGRRGRCCSVGKAFGSQNRAMLLTRGADCNGSHVRSSSVAVGAVGAGGCVA